MVNRLKKLSPQFNNILKSSSRFAKDAGYNIYLVGGVARDLLLNRPVFDLDIVVEGNAIMFVQKLAKYFGRGFRRHHSFGTATLYYNGHKIDFATARQEKYPHPGSLPKVKPSSLEKDLSRRDFTINSMAISLNKKNYGKLIDFYGGLNDLKNGLIRVLHPESFFDDSLRILRAVRFEQRFYFKIETKTYLLMKNAIGAGALKWINPHRLRGELILFLNEANPYRYIKRFYWLEKFNFINERIRLNKEDFRFFIRVQSAVKLYNKKNKGQDSFKPWIIYLAGILLKLPKNELVEAVNRFGFKKEERSIFRLIKSDLGKVRKLDRDLKPSGIYKMLYKYRPETIVFFYAYFPTRKLRNNIMLFLEKLSHEKLKIRGNDLKKIGVESSSFMGKILKKVFYLKLDKKLGTKQEELSAAKKMIKKV